jgi:hypothetical protein
LGTEGEGEGAVIKGGRGEGERPGSVKEKDKSRGAREGRSDEGKEEPEIEGGRAGSQPRKE